MEKPGRRAQQTRARLLRSAADGFTPAIDRAPPGAPVSANLCKFTRVAPRGFYGFLGSEMLYSIRFA